MIQRLLDYLKLIQNKSPNKNRNLTLIIIKIKTLKNKLQPLFKMKMTKNKKLKKNKLKQLMTLNKKIKSLRKTIKKKSNQKQHKKLTQFSLVLRLIWLLLFNQHNRLILLKRNLLLQQPKLSVRVKAEDSPLNNQKQWRKWPNSFQHH